MEDIYDETEYAFSTAIGDCTGKRSLTAGRSTAKILRTLKQVSQNGRRFRSAESLPRLLQYVSDFNTK